MTGVSCNSTKYLDDRQKTGTPPDGREEPRSQEPSKFQEPNKFQESTKFQVLNKFKFYIPTEDGINNLKATQTNVESYV